MSDPQEPKPQIELINSVMCEDRMRKIILAIRSGEPTWSAMSLMQELVREFAVVVGDIHKP